MNPVNELAEILSGIGKGGYIGPVEGTIVSVEPLCVSAFSGEALLKAPIVKPLKLLGNHSRKYSASSHFALECQTEGVTDVGGVVDHSHLIQVNQEGNQFGTITSERLYEVDDEVLLLPTSDGQSYYIIGVLG